MLETPILAVIVVLAIAAIVVALSLTRDIPTSRKGAPGETVAAC